MSDRILDKYVGHSKHHATELSSQVEAETLDDLGCFGWLRGVHDRAVMLELRYHNGNIDSFAYALLERAEFNPSDGITLHFAGKSVKIHGRNLNAEVRPNVRLLAGILRHRVPWIQEADEVIDLQAAVDATVIEGLEVKSRQ